MNFPKVSPLWSANLFPFQKQLPVLRAWRYRFPLYLSKGGVVIAVLLVSFPLHGAVQTWIAGLLGQLRYRKGQDWGTEGKIGSWSLGAEVSTEWSYEHYYNRTLPLIFRNQPLTIYKD
jgi:hypothetical protein